MCLVMTKLSHSLRGHVRISRVSSFGVLMTSPTSWIGSLIMFDPLFLFPKKMANNNKINKLKVYLFSMDQRLYNSPWRSNLGVNTLAFPMFSELPMPPIFARHPYCQVLSSTWARQLRLQPTLVSGKKALNQSELSKRIMISYHQNTYDINYDIIHDYQAPSTCWICWFSYYELLFLWTIHMLCVQHLRAPRAPRSWRFSRSRPAQTGRWSTWELLGARFELDVFQTWIKVGDLIWFELIWLCTRLKDMNWHAGFHKWGYPKMVGL